MLGFIVVNVRATAKEIMKETKANNERLGLASGFASSGAVNLHSFVSMIYATLR